MMAGTRLPVQETKVNRTGLAHAGRKLASDMSKAMWQHRRGDPGGLLPIVSECERSSSPLQKLKKMD